MNPTPDHLDDEILSALLDGDAGDNEAAAHLGACDRCAGRQGELAAARVALAGAPVEPVDELTRRRLVAAALQAAEEERTSEAAAVPTRARSRWASRHPALIGSAAAVILALLVGVPFVVGNDGSRDDETTLAAQAPGAAESAGSFLGDLGDLADRESLRQRLISRRLNDPYGYSAPMEPGPSPAAGAPAAGTSAAKSATPGAGGLASTTTVAESASPMAASGRAGAPAAEVTSDSAADTAAQANEEASRERADTDACVAALLNGPARGGQLTASGTGTFEGRPAIVAVFDLPGGRVAFVADRSGCVVRDRFAV
ncbi:MAG: hypothetical protein AB1679_21115 [Actinomycetota bacterium]